MRPFVRGLWNYRSLVVIIFTPLVLVPLPLVVRSKVAECAFVLLLMAVYWVTEVLPLSMTAMLPALLFPLFGIMKSTEVARVYFKDFHFLLIGVICLATSIQKWGVHRRIALKLVTLVGVNPAWLMLGFMVGCAVLSMWVHNTSAVTMVMPIVEAVIQQILRAEGEVTAGTENPGLQLNVVIRMTGGSTGTVNAQKKSTDEDPEAPPIPDEPASPTKIPASKTEGPCRSTGDLMICKALCICIAYSSNIGGIATLLGTSPNLILAEYINQFYPECDSINFGNWLLLCLPISIIMLLLSWIWLHWLFIGSGSQEVVTLGIFMLMAVLWLTRDPGFMPGWASLFPEHAGYTTDATVALLLGPLFFIIPAYGPSNNFEAMISWKEFQSTMPWEVALLVGGGFALAEGTQVSGLSSWVAGLLTPLADLPVVATVTMACVIVTSVTEVASNAATITIFLPILGTLAEAVRVNPLYVLIPTTLCTSFSFLLPVSNPANAVVFAYGHLNTIDMVKAGLGVNVIGVLAVLLAVTTWGTPLFALNTYPVWAPVLPPLNTTGL